MANEDFDPDIPGSFLGRGMYWPPQEDPDTGDLRKAADEESISVCIENLVHTDYETVPGFEGMGTEVEGLLFRADLTDVGAYVAESITRAIRDHEKRVFPKTVRVSDYFVDGATRNRRGFQAIIGYRVRATGQPASNVFPFLIN